MPGGAVGAVVVRHAGTPSSGRAVGLVGSLGWPVRAKKTSSSDGWQDLDVVDQDAGGVEGPDHAGGQPRPAAHGGVQAPAVVAHVHGAVDQGGQGGHGAGVGFGQGDLEAGPAGGRLELGATCPRR